MKVSDNNNKLTSKVINILLDVLIILFGLILLLFIYNTVQVKFLGQDYPSFLGITIFEVQSGSMEPEISKGDWIIVKKTNDYELNDIVTFKENEDFITHRIIKKYDDTYITKGDSNNTEDDEINNSQIIGEVSGVIPLFGILMMTIFNPIVLILIIIILYLCNWKMKNKGDKDMFNKLKELFNKVIPKSKKTSTQEEPSLFAEESGRKSFENIGSSPRIKDYEEKIEKYSREEFEEENKADELLVKENMPPKFNEETEDNDEDYEKEDDLSKTMFFRIISVNDDKKEENEEAVTLESENKEIAETSNESFEKENEETSEEIKNIDEENVSGEEEIEIDEEEKGLIEATLTEEDISEKTEDEASEKVDADEEKKLHLEMIFNKPENKKSKNVISRVIAIKEDEINTMIDLIMGESKSLTNEPSIKKALIKSYVESKYYNIFSEKVVSQELKKTNVKKKYVISEKVDVINEKNGFTTALKTRARKIISRIALALEEDATKLDKAYKGADRYYADKLEKYSMLLMLISKLEYLIDLPIDMKNKKIIYAREIIKYISDYKIDNENLEYTYKEIIKIQKKHRSTTKYFLNRLNTEMFELIYNQIKSNKSKYLVNLKHNINFSQVYNKNVVSKAYQEGIVAEDKLNVLMTLLQARLASDMLTSDFMNEYVVYLPNSLCQKESKFERLFKVNNEEYAKKNIIFLVGYDMFMKHSTVIKPLRKNGFRIAAYVNENTKFTSKNKTGIALAENIFIDKNTKGALDIEKVVFDNFKDKIIKDDLNDKIDFISEGE